ncbi:MAG: 50S ribosomal protein L11 methyltransferase [Pyrinomonadaceae bacterium]|nr:50S ribosomal protein L11 methyltransferase [Sphingobacteriaceae bacterium]
MNYFGFDFTINSKEEFHRDLLINALGEAGFDTFEETSSGFTAFISEDAFTQEIFDQAISAYQDMFAFSWVQRLIPPKNWNEVWESNFEPLLIKDQCYVRATFHKPQPQYRYEIVIDPKMSFGTGHHQTTTMMMEFILEENFENKQVLDMGAGTGILAILGYKCGAIDLTAIDYDQVCYDSMIENAQLNGVQMQVLCGSKEVIPNKQYDIILANINRNILLDQLERYAEVLKNRGELYLSGFFEHDLQILKDKCETLNLKYLTHKLLDNWCSAKFLKQT